MAKDVLITPADGKIEFKDTSVVKGTIYESSGDLYIDATNVVFGDGTPANLELGAAGTAVSMDFLGGGTITSSGNALNLGISGDTINLNVTGVTYNFPSSLLTTSTNFGGDVSGTYNAIVVADDSHNHVISNVDGLQTALDSKAELDHIRSLGSVALTDSTTTSALMSRIESLGAFNSYSSVFKSTWSYAGNSDLTDAGRLLELAGTSWLTWTDNSSDSTRGNITALVIAPTTGTSANKVFIYNDQGATYSPGWREIWTSESDGASSGLDADLLDGQHGSYYAPLASPALSGTPTAPTASAGTNTTQIATTAFVSTAVSNLINSAPGALDTLDELAAALGDDANFASTVTNALALKAPTASPTFTGDATFDTNTLYVDGTNDKVGIGTTTPSSLLTLSQSMTSSPYHIFMDTTGTSTLGGGAGIIFGTSASATETNYNAKIEGIRTASNDGSSELRFYTTDVTTAATPAERMRITEDGNVGIGTTSPSQQLEVVGNVKVTSSQPRIFLNDLEHGDYSIINNNGNFGINDDSNSAYRLYITSSGNVGIGTTSPDGLLHISSGNSGNAVVIIEADADNNNENDLPQLWFKADGDITEAAIRLDDNELQLVSNVTSGNGITFFTGSTNNTGTTDPATGATEKMRITNDGNVGIGTSTPVGRVDIFNNTLDTPTLFLGRYNGVDSPLVEIGESDFFGTTGSFGGALFHTQNRIMAFSTFNSTTFSDVNRPDLVIATDGNVGIGTASPSTKLHVAGNVEVGGSIGFGTSDGYINLSRGSFITFYEDNSTTHAIGSRDNAGNEADDLRINSYGAVYINLDSNNNNTGGADFMIGNHGVGTGTISELFRVNGENGNVTLSGTVDGRDIAADGTKLDGIEAGATANTGTVTSVATGGGLTGGTITTSGTISHADTSSQASVDNSNGTVIQDITLDTYGHVTAIGSVDLDGRYYTESETDTLLSAKANDTDVVKLTGNQTIANTKTFSSSPIFDAGARIGLSSGNTSDILLFDSAQPTYVGPGIKAIGTDLYYTYAGSNNSKIWHDGNVKERATDITTGTESTSTSTAGIDVFSAAITSGKRYRLLIMGTYDVDSTQSNLIAARIGLRLSTSGGVTIEGYWLNDESSNSLGTDNHETLRVTSLGTSRTYSTATSGSYFTTDTTTDTTTITDEFFMGQFVLNCTSSKTIYMFITNSTSLTGTSSQINANSIFIMEEI